MKGLVANRAAYFAVARRALIRAPIALAIALLALLAPVNAQAQTSANANANVNSGDTVVAVLRPLSITKLYDLDFGGNIATAAGGTVVLDPSGTDGCVATGVIHVGDICQAAEFGGGGESGRIIKINLPADITITGPGDDMLIDTITLDTDPDLVRANQNGNQNNNGFVRYRIASDSGIFRFRMGGTLNINPAQAPGEYTGTFEVRVDYQ